jgi:DNA/RNA endonuclease G (NUC1)
MKRFLSALLVSLLVSSTSYAAPSHCDQLVAYGYPQSATSLDTTQLCRIAYTVNHDNTRKTPIYSAELLLKENSSGDNP